MAARIHPTAIIDTTAELHGSVQVGPYSIIGAEVQIGEDSWIGPHVVLQGPLRLGARNKVFQFASVGEISQDKTAKPDDETAAQTLIANDPFALRGVFTDTPRIIKFRPAIGEWFPAA